LICASIGPRHNQRITATQRNMEECPICYVNIVFADDICRAHPCQHFVCRDCFGNMSHLHRTRCPMCRCATTYPDRLGGVFEHARKFPSAAGYMGGIRIHVNNIRDHMGWIPQAEVSCQTVLQTQRAVVETVTGCVDTCQRIWADAQTAALAADRVFVGIQTADLQHACSHLMAAYVALSQMTAMVIHNKNTALQLLAQHGCNATPV
jgi:hypothetical protein